ncbi:MAG: FAH family protein [Pelagibacterium sp. SCN 64-44]|nr:MAG: FAH family protein [Pelagibacterium sp. SCN 64-44]
MRLVQFRTPDGQRHVGVVQPDGNSLAVLAGVETTYALALSAIANGQGLEAEIAGLGREPGPGLDDLVASGVLLPPLDHPEPSRFWLTGTGLTHIGSAQARDHMHELAHSDGEAGLTDSMKIFKMGLEGGKPGKGKVGVQPEWFYKGTGTNLVAPEADMPMPAFALAGGEEAEIVGLYIIGPDGTPWRIGYALSNEFSDQVTEAQNYLYLAHSKLRACSMGPELLVGELPEDVRGSVRVIRDGKLVWEGEFASGEANMSHSIENLEHHHFRYDMFRRPGDLHAHFFGAPILSCANGVETRDGDLFEIDVPQFGRPLRNRMRRQPATPVTVKAL